MNNLVSRHQGQAVEIRDHTGRIHRGVIEGTDPPRGMFIRDRFRRRRFIPFFLIASIFLLNRRRRIF
ncbi:hypothetical protein [Jeotgalibacillus soli]|uniref:hypothetical protein n=1 Tax=Jeotgalibacillus soli TaxID=889306 RepID=UPI000596D3A6|nr:hypothetical protein [Jeotgalibacillus soli]